MIFRKKKTWYWPAFKALAFCWFLYKVAKRFLKTVSKQNHGKHGKAGETPLTLFETLQKIIRN